MGNTTGNWDSEKHMVVILITILSSENSSPLCQFLDGCYCRKNKKGGKRRRCSKRKKKKNKRMKVETGERRRGRGGKKKDGEEVG